MEFCRICQCGMFGSQSTKCNSSIWHTPLAKVCDTQMMFFVVQYFGSLPTIYGGPLEDLDVEYWRYFRLQDVEKYDWKILVASQHAGWKNLNTDDWHRTSEVKHYHRGSVFEDIAPSNSMHSSASNRLNLLRSTKAVGPWTSQSGKLQNEYLLKNHASLDIPGYNKSMFFAKESMLESWHTIRRKPGHLEEVLGSLLHILRPDLIKQHRLCRIPQHPCADPFCGSVNSHATCSWTSAVILWSFEIKIL